MVVGEVKKEKEKKNLLGKENKREDEEGSYMRRPLMRPTGR
jgi:hypothetical protein